MDKYLILICCALGFGKLAHGQTLLGPYLITSSDTVPTSEIWKVESILYSDSPFIIPTNNSMQTDAKIIIDGFHIICRSGRMHLSNGVALDTWEMKYPFWLDSGQIISPGNFVHGISILRFEK